MTDIWSPFLVRPVTAAEVLETWHAASAAGFANLQSLPWPLEDLAGSTWRQVHTGWLATARIAADDEGLPVLAWSTALYHGKSMGRWHRTPCDPWPALDHPGRYVIERWCRVDGLAVELQLAWTRVELATIEAEVAENTSRQRNLRLRRLLMERNGQLLQRREQLIAEAQALARAHHMAFDLNAEIPAGAGIQLRLV